MVTYPPRVRRDLDFGPRGNSRRALAPWAPANQQSVNQLVGWGFYTARGSIDPISLFVRVMAALAARWLHEPSQSSTSQWGWGFHTLRDGIDPGDLRFGPRVVGVVGLWNSLSSGDDSLYPPGEAGPRRCPEGQLSSRAGSMSPSQSATNHLGWGFHSLERGIDPGDPLFRPRLVGVVETWKKF